MKIAQVIIYLLSVWLLMTTFQQYSIKTTVVEAREPETFKLSSAKHGSELLTGSSGTTWVEAKRVYKRPSGPNPNGNHQSPSKS